VNKCITVFVLDMHQFTPIVRPSRYNLRLKNETLNKDV
jgi:hypothetical protein